MNASRCAILLLLASTLVLPSGNALAEGRTCNTNPRDFEGADWDVPANAILCSGDYRNIRNLTLRAGRTLMLGDGAQVTLRARSARILGTIDGIGAGMAGGAGCTGSARGGGSNGSGTQPGRGAPAYSTTSNSGGGGGGGAGHGGNGGKGGDARAAPGGAGGTTYGLNDGLAALHLGSGGGGGACGVPITRGSHSYGADGGWGGASLSLRARQVIIPSDAAIDMRGNQGSDGSHALSRPRLSGGGGGSGGTVVVVATERLSATGRVDVRGGRGGNGLHSLAESGYTGGAGGGGAGGRILYQQPGDCSTPGLVNATAGGGFGGTTTDWAGSPGDEGQPGLVRCTQLQRPPVIASVTASPNPTSEGTSVTIDVTASDPDGNLLKYAFDCEGDGTFEVGPQLSSQAQCFYDDNRGRTVRVRVTDWNSIPFTNASGDVLNDTGTVALGGVATSEVFVEVENVKPVVDLSAPVELDEGGLGEFLATVSDPSAADTAAGFTVHWDFGESGRGNFSAPGALTASHTYQDNGTYALKVRATDKDGGTGEKTASVLVRNVAPTISLGAVPGGIEAGQTVAFEATALDPSPTDEAAGFRFVFLLTGPGGYQEQQVVVNGPSVVQRSFVVGGAGAYTLTVTAEDKDGGVSVPATTVVPVGAGHTPPPTVTLSAGSTTVDAGQPVSFTAVIQAGSMELDPTYEVEWRFGDGSQPVRGTDLTSVAHTFLDQGTYTVLVTVIDVNGQSGADSRTITVSNVAPSASITTHAVNGNEGQLVTFKGVGVDSPGDVAAGLRYLWDFGDGNQRDQVNLREVTHVYQDNRPGSAAYVVTLVVIDREGAESDPVTASAQIANVPPTVTVQLPESGDEGQQLEFVATVTDPSPVDTSEGFAFQWRIRPEGQPSGGTVVTGTNRTPIHHTFPDNGRYTVTVTVEDKDGGANTTSATIEISNVPPRVTIGADIDTVRRSPVHFSPRIFDPGANEQLGYLWNFGDGNGSIIQTPSHTYTNLGEYTVLLVVTDKDAGAGQDSIVVRVRNQPPVASAVVLSPSFPQATDPLTLSYAYQDGDDDPESGTVIRWFVDGEPDLELDGMRTIPPSRTVRGQRWQVQVTPRDGLDFGEPVMSEPVGVGNEAPDALDVRIVPDTPRRADNLQVTYTFADPDGDPELGTRVSWQRNGLPVPELADELEVPPPLRKGDRWRVTVQAGDGAAFGPQRPSSEVTVANTPPEIAQLANVAVPAQGLQTPVELSVLATDVDGDPLTYRWEYSRQTIGTNSWVVYDFPLGSHAVTVTVSDGTASVTGTAMVSVGQVAPTVNAGPDRTASPGLLSLAATADDPLGRHVSWSWSVLSSPVELDLDGDRTATPTFFARVPGQYHLRATATAGGQSAFDDVRITLRDLPPSAVAWPPRRVVRIGESVALDGRQSADPNGDELTYAWSQLSGSPVTFEGEPSEALVTIVPHSPGELIFRLTVSDGEHVQDAHTTLLVAPEYGVATIPVVVSEGPGSVLTGETGVLDGRHSFDLDGDRLTFRWRQVEGPAAVLEDADSAVARFVIDQPGAATFRLVVGDGATESYRDVAVEVVDFAGRTRPAASTALSSVSGKVGERLQIDGQADSAGASFHWKQVAGPAVTLETEGRSVLLVPTVEGTLGLELMVVVDGIESRPRPVTVRVGESRPFASAEGPGSGFPGDSMALDGSASMPGTDAPLSYSWSQVEGPATAVLSEAAGPLPTFVPRTNGTYTFELAVSDGRHTSDPVRVEVFVEGLPDITGGCSCGGGGAGLLALGALLAGVLRRRRRV